MLDIKYIIANLDEVKKKTANRKAEFDFDLLISLDEKRKSLQSENDLLKSERNRVSKEIGAVKKKQAATYPRFRRKCVRRAIR